MPLNGNYAKHRGAIKHNADVQYVIILGLGYHLVFRNNPAQMPTLPVPLVALARLYPAQLQALAECIGMPKSNFQSALAGRRPFPKTALHLLFGALGLDNAGRLSTRCLYRWKVREVNDLKKVIENWLSHAKIYRIGSKNSPKVVHHPMCLLEGRVGYEPDNQVFAVIDGLANDVLNTLTPEIVLVGNLEIENLAVWDEATLPVEAVRAMLNQVTTIKQTPTWPDVIREAERLGRLPSEILEWLTSSTKQ